MARKTFIVDIDLNQNELQNAVIQNVATPPATAKPGQIWYNSQNKLLYYYDGTNNKPIGYLAPATADTLGGVKIGANVIVADDGTISVKDATQAVKGVIRVATDAEVETGTSTVLAINPKQLAALKAIVDGKIGLTALSSTSSQLVYDSTTGQFSLKVDTDVTENSANLITSGAVKKAINAELVGALKYEGTWTITGATDYSGIALPVKKGYMYLCQGEGPVTVGGIEWNAGDYLVIDEDVAVGGTITNVSKIDNTESADIVRLNATQTITNKTIDADANTIKNIKVDNFKSGVVQTTVRDSATATDTSLATEKAIRTAIDTVKTGMKKVVTNAELVPSSGIATWHITNDVAADCIISVKKVADGEEVMVDVTYGEADITLKINATTTIPAGTYKATIIG